ncbi:MAG: Gfo/Idh/MocA family protein [Cytophagaceae bacterium]
MKEEKLGIALVGLGNYSQKQLAPALKESKHCYLAGIVTGSPEKAAKWKNDFGLKDSNIYTYDNFDEIADNPDIDVVYVVLPNSMHAEYSIRAAQAGKHVICEKPMALNSIEAKQIISACKDANVRFFVGYRLHFEPYNQEIKRLGQEKAFGNIKTIEAAMGFEVGSPDQWRLKHELGGGALMDVGIYCIQAARYITGMEPLAINYAVVANKDEKFKEVDGDIIWEIEFPGDIKAKCHASFSKTIDFVHVEAEKGWFELSPAFEYEGLSGKTSQKKIHLPNINQQTAQLDGMAECILNATSTTASGLEGLIDMQIIEAIYKAAETGEPVDLSERMTMHSADRRW